MVAAAIVGSAVVGAGASMLSSNKAADEQQDATNASIAAQQQSQNQALAAQQPFLNGGYAATDKLQDLLGLGTNTGQADFGSLNKPFSFDSSNLSADPGYQYDLQQGQNALDRRQAAGGTFYSGGGLQAASALNQGLASTQFNDAYNRQLNAFQTNRSNTLNPLQALAGEGQTAANTTSGTLTSGSNSLASLLTNNANAQGAAGIAGANAINSGLSNGLAAWQRQQLIGTLGNGGTSANSLYTGTASNYLNPGYDPYATGP